MKKQITIILLLIIAFVGKSQGTKSIIPIISQTSDFVDMVEKKYKNQIVNLEYDVIKDQKVLYKELYADVVYGIIVFGDNNIKDVDLSISGIVGDDWQVIQQDNQTEGIAMIYFTPKEDGMYRLDISAKLYNAESFGFYGILIFR